MKLLTVSRFWRDSIGRWAGILFSHDPIRRSRTCLFGNFFAFPCVQTSGPGFLPSASGAASEPPTTPPKTILFVEDETLVRMDMAEFLRDCGYCVQEAATAKEAIEALQANFLSTLCSPISICPRA